MTETRSRQELLQARITQVARAAGLAMLLTLLISCATTPPIVDDNDPESSFRDESGTRVESAQTDDQAGSGTPAESGNQVASNAKSDSGAPAASDLPTQKGVPAEGNTPAESKATAVTGTPPETGGLVVSREEGGIRLLPEQGPGFWERIMTPDVAWEYRAINGVSQCTRYVADMLDLHFGHDAYLQVFPNGVRGANETFFDWIENKELVRLPPDQYSISDIQQLANQGYLILMAYYFPDVAGHVAFVGHKGLKLFTIPALNGLEGKDGVNLDSGWLPVMVQAGTYTGVTSMVYATNGWLRNDNYGQGIVRYYFVRGVNMDDQLDPGLLE